MNKKIFLPIASLLLVLAVSFTLLVTGCQEQVISPESTTNDITLDKPSFVPDGPDYVPGELLVKFKEGVTSDKKRAALNRISGTVSERILTRAMQHAGETEGLYLVKTSKTTREAINSMKSLPDIEFAEPNYIYYPAVNSNDPYYTNGSLWGMYGNLTTPANLYGSQAGELYPTTGSTVYIGVIDEGIFYSHEDLLGQLGNPNEIPNNKIDDDGNGYVDDVYGWDFDGKNNTVYDGTADDHGTHVAGTIGAVGNNNKGVAGVCWSVKMINAKFLGKRGGTTANAILAVDYFTDLHSRGVNIIATNNSWGGGGYSTGLYQAIERANEEGILFIAAAGNSGVNTDVTPFYPACYNNSNIISVASITSTGAKSSFSNYGAATVDIGAPGSAIYSTIPGTRNTSKYASYSGTSMATPHITGAAALYYMLHSNADAAAIKSAILSGALSTSSLNNKCVTGGRLDVSGF